tara:strand:- start:738 stop:1097 length:360 start_codon:yes stop_codon:yes gene_type:complete
METSFAFRRPAQIRRRRIFQKLVDEESEFENTSAYSILYNIYIYIYSIATEKPHEEIIDLSLISFATFSDVNGKVNYNSVLLVHNSGCNRISSRLRGKIKRDQKCQKQVVLQKNDKLKV